MSKNRPPPLPPSPSSLPSPSYPPPRCPRRLDASPRAENEPFKFHEGPCQRGREGGKEGGREEGREGGRQNRLTRHLGDLTDDVSPRLPPIFLLPLSFPSSIPPSPSLSSPSLPSLSLPSRQSIADPSAVTAKIQAQIREREKNHEMRNLVGREAGRDGRRMSLLPWVGPGRAE